MEKHVRIIGWLYLVHGGMILLGALFGGLAVFAGGIASQDLGVMISAPFIAALVAVIVGVVALPSLLAGWGLHNGKGWARVLALVMGALSFFSFPLGTALCVYSFWALWGEQTDPIFEGHYPRHYA